MCVCDECVVHNNASVCTGVYIHVYDCTLSENNVRNKNPKSLQVVLAQSVSVCVCVCVGEFMCVCVCVSVCVCVCVCGMGEFVCGSACSRAM